MSAGGVAVNQWTRNCSISDSRITAASASRQTSVRGCDRGRRSHFIDCTVSSIGLLAEV